MSFLLDADWTISFLNGRANAIRLIEKLADEGLALSIITWGEICEGLLSRPDPPRHITQFEQFTTFSSFYQSLLWSLSRLYEILCFS